MGQNVCRRCGNGFYYKEGLTLLERTFAPIYCPSCEKYRSEKMSQAVESFREETKHEERCVQCGGVGSIGKNKLRCIECDGKGYNIVPDSIGELIPSFRRSRIYNAGESFALTDKILKKLPKDYEKKRGWSGG